MQTAIWLMTGLNMFSVCTRLREGALTLAGKCASSRGATCGDVNGTCGMYITEVIGAVRKLLVYSKIQTGRDSNVYSRTCIEDATADRLSTSLYSIVIPIRIDPV